MGRVVVRVDCAFALLSLKSSARSSTDRASDYGSEGWGFESLRAHSFFSFYFPLFLPRPLLFALLGGNPPHIGDVPSVGAVVLPRHAAVCPCLWWQWQIPSLKT